MEFINMSRFFSTVFFDYGKFFMQHICINICDFKKRKKNCKPFCNINI